MSVNVSFVPGLTDRYGTNLERMPVSYAAALLRPAAHGLADLPPFEPTAIQPIDVAMISGGAAARVAIVQRLITRAAEGIPPCTPFDVVDRVARAIYAVHSDRMPVIAVPFGDLSEYERSCWMACAEAAIVALE